MRTDAQNVVFSKLPLFCAADAKSLPELAGGDSLPNQGCLGVNNQMVLITADLILTEQRLRRRTPTTTHFIEYHFLTISQCSRNKSQEVKI